jgi:hypothetical protein
MKLKIVTLQKKVEVLLGLAEVDCFDCPDTDYDKYDKKQIQASRFACHP